MKNIKTQFISLTLILFAFTASFSHVSFAQALEITPDTVIELVSQDRVSHGFQSLQVNGSLTQAAQEKADDMAKNVYFAHTSPQGVTPWYWIQKSGYDYRFAGENLAIHFTDAQEEEQAWMASVKHKENILSPKYQDIGVAVKNTVQNGQATIIVVQMFGLPSGIIVPVASSKIDTETKKVTSNALISSIGFTKQDEAIITPSHEPSVGYFATTHAWMRWFGLLVAVIILGAGLTGVIVNRKVLYCKWFHKNDTFLYRA